MGRAVETGGNVIEMLRDTVEYWQSEFLKLLWQVAGLTIRPRGVVSVQRESEDRDGELLAGILRKVDPKHAEEFLARLARRYPKD